MQAIKLAPPNFPFFKRTRILYQSLPADPLRGNGEMLLNKTIDFERPGAGHHPVHLPTPSTIFFPIFP
jgi:hypothetical protein